MPQNKTLSAIAMLRFLIFLIILVTTYVQVEKAGVAVNTLASVIVCLGALVIHYLVSDYIVSSSYAKLVNKKYSKNKNPLLNEIEIPKNKDLPAKLADTLSASIPAASQVTEERKNLAAVKQDIVARRAIFEDELRRERENILVERIIIEDECKKFIAEARETAARIIEEANEIKEKLIFQNKEDIAQQQDNINKRQAELESIFTKKRAELETQFEELKKKYTLEAETIKTKLLPEYEFKARLYAEAKKVFLNSFSAGRVWLSSFIGEAEQSIDIALADALEYKNRAAPKAAEEVRRLSLEKRELRSELARLKYTLATYHEYYPVLLDYQDEILNEEATVYLGKQEECSDYVRHYISLEDYESLSVSDRNQLALDKWKARKKSKVEIGRLYERYLGYLYEKEGWDVTYNGAISGLEDMGRDLICRKGNNVHVVQAKNWSKHKTIHEKHIFQLHGTSVLLPLENPELADCEITAVFATTTTLSEKAKYAAKHLGVVVRFEELADYPLIKCNINGKGERIYHLPFDQQYDRVKIGKGVGEFYASTVAEAEKKRFRRAFRYSFGAGY